MAQLADFFTIRGAALAIAGTAIVKHELAAAERNLQRHTPIIALEIARGSVVFGFLVAQADAQTEALHDRAEIVASCDRPVGVVREQETRRGRRAARTQWPSRGGLNVLANLVVPLEGYGGGDRAVVVNDVAAHDVGMAQVRKVITAVANGRA